MITVDVCFPAHGSVITWDHGYPLYAALSKVVPELHGADWLSVLPIRGTSGGALIRLQAHSRVALRLPVERVSTVLPLIGKTLDLSGFDVRLGAPEIRPVLPSTSLDARVVAIKSSHIQRLDNGKIDLLHLQTEFSQELTRQLVSLGVTKTPCLVSRQFIAVKGKRNIGWTVRIPDLSEKESLDLQVHGVGGKRRLGCGVFTPTHHRRSPATAEGV